MTSRDRRLIAWLAGLLLAWCWAQPTISAEGIRFASSAAAAERAPAAQSDLSLGQRIVTYLWETQRSLQRQLAASFRSYKEERSAAAAWLLVSLGFLYGVFHAAGPGHGKAVIAAYLLAHEHRVRRGLILSAASAVLQGVTAVLLVEATLGLLGMASRDAQSAAGIVETVSFGLTMAIGAWLSVQAVRRLSGLLASRRGATGLHDGDHRHSHACHHHAPVADASRRGGEAASVAGILLSVGLRPCSGAVLILILAHAFDMRLAGIGSVFAMSAGTAIAVSALALLALYARRLAVALATRRSGGLAFVGQGFALLAGLTILAVGASLLIGSLGQSPASPLS